MAVQYVRVRSLVDSPATVSRATGNLAIIGASPTGEPNVPFQMTRPADAIQRFGPAFTSAEPPALNSALTRAVATAFEQTPGPGQVWAVSTGPTLTAANVVAALTAVEILDVQFVVLANTPLNAQTGVDAGLIGLLAGHVDGVSNAADGKERMGVVMLAKDSVDTALVTGKLASDRMVFVAHRSDGEVAPAVAGTIAGYPPHISMVLKPVAISSPSFTAAQIDTLNLAEQFGDAPKGKGVNWLTSPALLPGQGVYLGEGYTGKVAGSKYIDVQRVVDDVTFKIKARLARSIGILRMSRVGLRGLSVQLEAVLAQLVRDGVLDSFTVRIPVLDLLDKDPSALTPVELQLIKTAQDSRAAQVLVSVDYNGGIHRINAEFLLN